MRLALSLPGYHRDMLGSLSMTPVLLEGRKEYSGLETLKDAGQRVRAEA